MVTAAAQPTIPRRVEDLPRLVAGAGAAGLCLVASVLVGSRAPGEEDLGRATLQILIVGMPMVAGIYALGAARTRPFGWLLIAAGSVWALTALAESSGSIAYSVGRVAGWAVLPMLLYLLLVFPNGALQSRADRRLAGPAILLLVGLYAASALFVDRYPGLTPWTRCTDDCPANAFMIVDRQPAVMDAVVQPLREGLTVMLFLAVIAVLVERARTTNPFRRRAVLPVIAMTVANVVLLGAFFVARWTSPGGEAVEGLGWIAALAAPGIAVAFLAGMVRQRMMLGDTLSELNRDLRSHTDLADARATLARTWRDERVEVLVPDAATRAWRTSRGAIVTSATLRREERRLAVIRDDQGQALAAIVHNGGVEDDELLDGVRGFLCAALQYTRARKELARSLLELDQSRARIARAADIERSRIERDLHDGAQQRLIALRMRLTLVQDVLRQDPARWAEALDALGAEVDATLEELRALAHGVYPSLLTDRGLADALRGVAARAIRPVGFKVDGLGRYPPEVETAVYFTCVEALQNACKHAATARSIRLELWRDDGISFTVTDDGPGFRPPGERTGGLRNMHDRIEAVGGVLTIESEAGHGTRVAGFVPLSAAGARPVPACDAGGA